MESRVKNLAEGFVEGAENFVEGAMHETPKEGSDRPEARVGHVTASFGRLAVGFGRVDGFCRSGFNSRETRRPRASRTSSDSGLRRS